MKRHSGPDLKTEASFFSSAKVLWKSRGSSAEEFCYFDGRSGLPTVCISAMILVALQNYSLIVCKTFAEEKQNLLWF